MIEILPDELASDIEVTLTTRFRAYVGISLVSLTALGSNVISASTKSTTESALTHKSKLLSGGSDQLATEKDKEA
jgi:hypothetical protein